MTYELHIRLPTVIVSEDVEQNAGPVSIRTREVQPVAKGRTIGRFSVRRGYVYFRLDCVERFL